MSYQLVKIKNLPTASSLQTSDVLPVDTVPGGVTVTRKTTVAVLAAGVGETSELAARYVRLNVADRIDGEVPAWNAITQQWESTDYIIETLESSAAEERYVRVDLVDRFDDGIPVWSNAVNDWLLVSLPQPLGQVAIIGVLPTVGDLPGSGNVGDAYLIDNDLWIWDGVSSTWVNAGNISSIQILTTTQRNALTPYNGQVIFHVNIDRLEVYANGVWNIVGESFFLPQDTVTRDLGPQVMGRAVFNTDTSRIEFYDGSQWLSLVASLADLADVDVSGVADLDLLTYDSGGSNWVPLARTALVPSARTISVSGTGMSGGGDLTANRTITLDPSALAADAAFPALYAPKTITVNTRTANYSLVVADQNTLVIMNSASNLTVTVPTNASQSFPVGAKVDVWRQGTGQVTFAAAAGVTVLARESMTKIRVRYGAATLIKIATDTWLLAGDLD